VADPVSFAIPPLHYRGFPVSNSRVVLVLTALVAACGGGSPQVVDLATRDSAGITIVENPETGAWPADFSWQLHEDLRIAPRGDDPLYSWEMVAGVVEDSRGNVLVLDAGAQAVRVYDSTGSYLRSIGGPGGGPGELGMAGGLLGGMFAGTADSLMVVDLGNMRVNRYAPDGSPTGSVPVSIEGGVPAKWAVLPDGRLLQQRSPMVMFDPSAEPGANRIVVTGPDGAERDTVALLPEGQILDMSKGIGGMAPRLLYPESHWDVTRDGGVLLGESSKYEFQLRDPDGTVRMIVRREWTPRPVSAADRDRIIAGMTKGIAAAAAGNPQFTAMMDQMMENIDIAPTLPAYGGLRAGPRGTILVQEAAIPEDSTADGLPTADSSTDTGWTVFDRDGRLLGRLRLPEGHRLLLVTETSLFTVTETEDGEPVLVRFVTEPLDAER
jgi:hypothetical protein